MPDNPSIASSAIIESGAKIGKNVRIGHNTFIGRDVEIGDDCVILNNATILGSTKIGKGNRIYSNACIGVEPQDLKFGGEKTYLEIGDDNIFREFVTISLGTNHGGGTTYIGSRSLFMAYSHIAHDCKVGNECIFSNVATLAGHVEIGDFVNIGGLSAVHQFVKIGAGCMIGGGSILTQDLPPYSLAQGNHAKIFGLNRHRMRKLFEISEINSIIGLYTNLYSKSAPIKELAQRYLDEEALSPNERYICEFILSTTRGIPEQKGFKNGKDM